MVGRIKVVSGGAPKKKEKPKSALSIQVVKRGGPTTRATVQDPTGEKEKREVAAQKGPEPIPDKDLFSGQASSAEDVVQTLAPGGAAKSVGAFAVGVGFKKIGKFSFGSLKRLPKNQADAIRVGKETIKTTTRGQKITAIAAGTLATAYVFNEFLLSPNELAVWAAVDNISGLISFQIKNIVDGVKFDNADPAEAEARIAEAEQFISGARKFVNFWTMVNPKLWAGRNTLLSAVDVAAVGVENQKIRLAELTTPEAIEAKEVKTEAQRLRDEAAIERAEEPEPAEQITSKERIEESKRISDARKETAGILRFP